MLTQKPLSVALVGVGGTGSKVLIELIHLDAALRARGYGGLAVHAFDPDVVSEANLVRQAFSPADLGFNKAEVLVHRINLHQHLDWSACPARFDSRASRERWDIVISCVDTRAARAQLHGWAFRSGFARWKLWMDCGNAESTGQVVLGTPKRKRDGLPCATELFPEIRDTTIADDTTPSCGVLEALQRQHLFVNLWAATAAVGLLSRALSAEGTDHHGTFFNLATGEMRSLPIPTNEPRRRRGLPAATTADDGSPRRRPQTPAQRKRKTTRKRTSARTARR